MPGIVPCLFLQTAVSHGPALYRPCGIGITSMLQRPVQEEATGHRPIVRTAVSQNLSIWVGNDTQIVLILHSPPIFKSNFPLTTKKTYIFYLEEAVVWMLCFTSYTLQFYTVE